MPKPPKSADPVLASFPPDGGWLPDGSWSDHAHNDSRLTTLVYSARADIRRGLETPASTVRRFSEAGFPDALKHKDEWSVLDTFDLWFAAPATSHVDGSLKRMSAYHPDGSKRERPADSRRAFGAEEAASTVATWVNDEVGDHPKKLPALYLAGKMFYHGGSEPEIRSAVRNLCKPPELVLR